MHKKLYRRDQLLLTFLILKIILVIVIQRILFDIPTPYKYLSNKTEPTKLVYQTSMYVNLNWIQKYMYYIKLYCFYKYIFCSKLPQTIQKFHLTCLHPPLFMNFIWIRNVYYKFASAAPLAACCLLLAAPTAEPTLSPKRGTSRAFATYLFLKPH